MERLQVAADGHVGNTEIADEVGHAYGSILPDTVKDEGLALSRKHQATLTEPCLRTALDPSSLVCRPHRDCRATDRKSTYPNNAGRQPSMSLDMPGADT